MLTAAARCVGDVVGVVRVLGRLDVRPGTRRRPGRLQLGDRPASARRPASGRSRARRPASAAPTPRPAPRPRPRQMLGQPEDVERRVPRLESPQSMITTAAVAVRRVAAGAGRRARACPAGRRRRSRRAAGAGRRSARAGPSIRRGTARRPGRTRPTASRAGRACRSPPARRRRPAKCACTGWNSSAIAAHTSAPAPYPSSPGTWPSSIRPCVPGREQRRHQARQDAASQPQHGRLVREERRHLLEPGHRRAGGRPGARSRRGSRCAAGSRSRRPAQALAAPHAQPDRRAGPPGSAYGGPVRLRRQIHLGRAAARPAAGRSSWAR